MIDLYSKHLRNYKTMAKEDIKKDVFKLFSKLIHIDSKNSDFLYSTILVVSFVGQRDKIEGIELANEINNKFKICFNTIPLNNNYNELKQSANSKQKDWLQYLSLKRKECYGFLEKEKEYKSIVQYIVACMSYKKSINEKELMFLEYIGRVSLNKKIFIYDANNPKKIIVEDNFIYLVISNVNYEFSENPSYLWGPTIELEGKANTLEEANNIAKEAYDKKFKKRISHDEDDVDWEIKNAIDDGEPVKISYVRISGSKGRGLLFLKVFPLDLNEVKEYSYICVFASIDSEGASFEYYDIDKYYRSREDVVKFIECFEEPDDCYIDKDCENLTIEFSDDVGAPEGLLKFIKIN